MKTSQIISALAVLFTVATLMASPTGKTDKTSKGKSHVCATAKVPILKASETVKDQFSPVNTLLDKGNFIPADNDLHYLKFNVEDYYKNSGDKADKFNTPITVDDNTFDYLKFDVDSYTYCKDGLFDEALELPSDALGYLKFHATNFISEREISLDQISELPFTEFSYLKFNPELFVETDQLNSGIDSNLEPVFDYLKFDVNTFIDRKNVRTDEVFNSPETEFSYLKFQVNSYLEESMNGSQDVDEL